MPGEAAVVHIQGNNRIGGDRMADAVFLQQELGSPFIAFPGATAGLTSQGRVERRRIDNNLF